jgi:hypothetical protein
MLWELSINQDKKAEIDVINVIRVPNDMMIFSFCVLDT